MQSFQEGLLSGPLLACNPFLRACCQGPYLHAILSRGPVVRALTCMQSFLEGLLSGPLPACSLTRGNFMGIPPTLQPHLMAHKPQGHLYPTYPTCLQVGGLLLVAPEHRASLRLKRDEIWLWGDRAVTSQLDLLAALPYVDVVDENDVVLSHKWVTVARLPVSSGWLLVKSVLQHMCTRVCICGGVAATHAYGKSATKHCTKHAIKCMLSFLRPLPHFPNA